MNSRTIHSFWDEYETLDAVTKERARKAFDLWTNDHSHPSLQFKCVNIRRNYWSVRISGSIRAIGKLEGTTVTWFWIGSHDDYERIIK